jgi:Helix-turn-helix domain
MLLGEKRLTPAEVASELGVEIRTLTNWRSARKGPAYYAIARNIFYRASDVESWIESQRKETPKQHGSKKQERHMALALADSRPRGQREHRFGGYQTKRERGPETSGTGA